MSKHQSYYMVLPSEIWDAEITARAMILYGHITVLANKKKYCYANNAYFEKTMKSSNSSIARAMKELEDKGFIRREIIYKENSKEIEERKIFLTTGIVTDDNSPIVTDDNSPIITDDLDNSTSSNKTRPNNKNSDELLLDKIIEQYPGNVNTKGPILTALKSLTKEEKILALKNLERYTKAANGYYLNLRNYLESKAFSERELLKKETKLKKQDTTDTKTFSGKY